MQIKHITKDNILHIAVFIDEKKMLLIPLSDLKVLPKREWLLGDHDYRFRLREDGGVTAYVKYVVDGTSSVIESDAEMSEQQVLAVDHLYEVMKERDRKDKAASS